MRWKESKHERKDECSMIQKSCHVGISHVIRAKNPRKEDVVGIVISMNNDNMANCAGSCLPGSEYASSHCMY